MSKEKATYGVFEQTRDDKGEPTLVLRYNPAPFGAVMAACHNGELEAAPDATLFLAEVRQEADEYIFVGGFYSLVASREVPKTWNPGELLTPPVKSVSIHI